MDATAITAVGEAFAAIRKAEPEAERPPGVLYVKCFLKFAAGAVWSFGTAYILGKYSTDTQEMIKIFQNIALPAGVVLFGLSRGCLKLSLRADSLSSLKELWKRYTEGALQKALSQALLTPDLLQFAEGKNVELEAQIDERIYREACLDLTVKSVIKVHQDGRNTSLSRRRCQSESNINLILNASHRLTELSLEAKPQKEREEMKIPVDETQPETSEVHDLQLPRPPTVLFLTTDEETVFQKVITVICSYSRVIQNCEFLVNHEKSPVRQCWEL